MKIVFETGRLILRKFTTEDAELIYNLNLDPDVTRYTLDPLVDLDHASKILKEVILAQYNQNGFGRWAVHLKPGMEFIGWSGLKWLPQTGEVDLGYRYMKNYWGKGYATEAAAACLELGFTKFQLERIVGRALPANAGSIRVLQKLGMTYKGQEMVQGLLHETYERFRPNIPA